MTRFMRKLHKWIGLLVGLQFLVWLLSGLGMSLLDAKAVSGEDLAAFDHDVQAVDPALGLVEPQSILESLPEHVIVIGTTTSITWADDVDGLYSRWRRFRFRKPDAKAVAEHLERIAGELGLPIPDGFRFLSYVQGKYGEGRSCGNNLRDLIDQLPDALRRFKVKPVAAAA